MNRSDEPLFDARIADWLEQDPHRAPDQTLDVVLAAFPSLKQRSAWRAPWRNPSMSIPVRVGLIAATVVLAATAVFTFTRPKEPSIGAPTPSPSPTASQPEASSSGPSTPAPPTTTTYTSPIYGYTIEHPVAYQPTPATEAWVDGVVGNTEPWVDRFFSPISFVGIASQPLDGGASESEWLDAYGAAAVGRQPCSVPLDAWTATTVDGSSGRRAEFECEGSAGVEIVWVVDGRGWVISGEGAVVDQMIATLTTQ